MIPNGHPGIYTSLTGATAQGLARVTVYRDSSGDTCSYFGPMENAR